MNKAIKTVLGGVLFVVIWIGLWNLFDFIWKTWINGSGYQFSSSYHILYPLGIGVVMYLILFVFNTVKNKIKIQKNLNRHSKQKKQPGKNYKI